MRFPPHPIPHSVFFSVHPQQFHIKVDGQIWLRQHRNKKQINKSKDKLTESSDGQNNEKANQTKRNASSFPTLAAPD